jgi:hypothetical protein
MEGRKMKKRLEKILSVTLLVAIFASMTLPVFMALSEVEPSELPITLNEGESEQVTKYVTTPSIPPKLDLLLLEDETGSFWDDIDEMQGTPPEYEDGLALAIWDELVDREIDFTAGVAGFRDFAYNGWGDPGDWVYRLLEDQTNIRADYKSAILTLSDGGGYDTPEAQLAALMSIAEGTGWDGDGDDVIDPSDPEDTPAGQNPTWREGATKVVLLVTDAPYHVYGDEEYPDNPSVDEDWPGPTYADTRDELQADGIHVIILTVSGASGYYGTLATDTGGVVKLIADDSSDIVDAVFDALDEILTDVWYEVGELPEGVEVTLTPEVNYDVAGDTTVEFEETITVTGDASPGTYEIEVTFYSNTYPEEGSEIGTQTITLTVEGPCCENAYADPDLLWPPNHQWVEIGIEGVTHTGGEPVTITVTGVWQDEPTEGLGDGDHSPDAVIHDGIVEVRAERSGIEDGRVYHIYFTATDEYGGVCEGEVTVGVPHDKKDTPIDGGALYDSTLP